MRIMILDALNRAYDQFPCVRESNRFEFIDKHDPLDASIDLKDESSSKNVEVYNENGRLLRKIPPGCLPLDQII
jgi:hypothetical protein